MRNAPFALCASVLSLLVAPVISEEPSKPKRRSGLKGNSNEEPQEASERLNQEDVAYWERLMQGTSLSNVPPRPTPPPTPPPTPLPAPPPTLPPTQPPTLPPTPVRPQNPPRNSVIAAHGDIDWIQDTAHEFLFGTDMNGILKSWNHAPNSWTRSHIHIGQSFTNGFFHDASLVTNGFDSDDKLGMDRAMLSFYVGHGNPGSFNALGNQAMTSNMLLGNENSGTRYFWACSCEVFAHGPESCGFPFRYSCPEEFTPGSSDSQAMRNVYERLGPVLGRDLRMACGGSTELWCHPYNVDRIWDNYNNNGYDVADSWVFGVEANDAAVGLCIANGGSDIAQSPLFDQVFTNLPNSFPDEYYHIGYLVLVRRNRNDEQEVIVPNVPEQLPKLKLIPQQPPNSWLERATIEQGDLLTSSETIGERGPKWIINTKSGAMYGRGPRLLNVTTLSEEQYFEIAAQRVAELEWTEELQTSPKGAKMIIDIIPRESDVPVIPKREELKRVQKSIRITYHRLIEIGDSQVPVIGNGGRIVVQLNNDGSLLNAVKVWRAINGTGSLLSTKPYSDAVAEAEAALGDGAENYRLSNLAWGYKEETGNIEQAEMLMYYQFYFVPISSDLLLEYPARSVEIEGMLKKPVPT